MNSFGASLLNVGAIGTNVALIRKASTSLTGDNIVVVVVASLGLLLHIAEACIMIALYSTKTQEDRTSYGAEVKLIGPTNLTAHLPPQSQCAG